MVWPGFSFHFRNLHQFHLLILCSTSNSQWNSHFWAVSLLSLNPPEMITAANPFPLQISPGEQTRKSLPTLLQLFIQPFNHHLSKITPIKANTGLAFPPAGPEKGYFVHFGTPRTCSNLWHRLFNSSSKKLTDQPDMHCQVSHNVGAGQAAKELQFIWRSDKRGVGMSRSEWILFTKSVWKLAEARVITGWFCPEKGRYVLVYPCFFSFLFQFWPCGFQHETGALFTRVNPSLTKNI